MWPLKILNGLSVFNAASSVEDSTSREGFTHGLLVLSADKNSLDPDLALIWVYSVSLLFVLNFRNIYHNAGNFHHLSSDFEKNTFPKILFSNTISISLDPDQARCLLAEDTSK